MFFIFEIQMMHRISEENNVDQQLLANVDKDQREGSYIINLE